MLNLNSLFTAIITKIGATTPLSAIQNKTAYGYIAEGVARPKCRFSVVSDGLESGYGSVFLNEVSIQFSVFADSLSSATSIQNALASAFQGVQLTLSSGTNISCRVKEGWQVLVEGQKPDAIVYHSIVVVDFTVLS